MEERKEEDNRLFLIDGFALIYRAYFAFIKNPRVNSQGMNTSAAFGFTNFLNELIRKQQPSHLAVVFDPMEEPTGRLEAFADYKANRESMPEDIKQALPYIARIVDAMNIPLLVVEGFEADDVIGTLAQKAETEGYVTYMVTSDKDYGQLVTDKILWYRPGRMQTPDQVLGPKEVCEKFGLERPEQVIDLLGLMGDAVDNIPGVPGVGEKTAVKLLQEYGSMEQLLEQADRIKGKLGEKIRDNKDKALLSRQLATIITDVPIDFDPKALHLDPPNEKALKEVFAELEFRNLAEKMLGQSLPGQAPDLFSLPGSTTLANPQKEALDAPQTIADWPHQYFTVNDPNWRADVLALLSKQPRICFDTETTALQVMDAKLVGLAFSIKPGQAFYFPVPENKEAAVALLNEFLPLFSQPNITWIGQNLKYDVSVMARNGISIAGPMFDTMLAHYILQPEQRHNMDHLAITYLGYQAIPTSDLIGSKGKHQKTMREVPVEQVAEYACEDVDVTIRLAEIFEPALQEVNGEAVFQKAEMPLIRVLSAMELEGIAIDQGALKEMSQEFDALILQEQGNIMELAGIEFNPSSPKQLGEVLFDHLKLDERAKKTRTGQYSTNEETLKKLEGKHPIVAHIFEWRELQKLKSTYIDALPNLVHPDTGRIHTSYNQAVAATGRLSSQNPNLQNIPIRSERGRRIRKAFVPRDAAHKLLAADYSQVELRVIAALSKEEHMIEAFQNHLDIHASTAARVFGVGLNQVDKSMRSKAKMVNFGIIYGISAFGLAQRLGIPRREAAEIIQAYFDQYPGIKTYMDQQIAFAKANGFVETVLGRRRYLPDIHSANPTVRGFAERNAINAPIQGSAADIIKLAMIRLFDAMQEQKLQSKLVLQVHDELVFDAHTSELETLKSLVVTHMEQAYAMEVPLVVEVNHGNNWLEAH